MRKITRPVEPATLEDATSPRPAQSEPPATAIAPPVSPPSPAPVQAYQPAFLLVGETGGLLFGLDGKERLRRQLRRAGLTNELAAELVSTHRGPLIVIRADAAIDQPLIDVLVAKPGLVLTTEAGYGKLPLAANVRAMDATRIISAFGGEGQGLPPLLLQRAPSELDTSFWKALRKKETPYAMLVNNGNRGAVEWRIFMGTYKGATDVVTKHLWPRPAFHVTRLIAPMGVTPNMVTGVAAIFTILAFVLFWKGQFVPGLLAAWAMTFLDTVDGKLARTTMTSSKWGDVFDHAIDLVHPPFWYFAWGVGLAAWGFSWSDRLFWWVMGVILAGYVLQRVMEGIAIKWLGLEIHIWRKIDTLFRQVTARRNPNLIILTAFTIFSRPDWGLLVVAAWTGICLVLHALQLVQAFVAKPAGEKLQSWMQEK